MKEGKGQNGLRFSNNMDEMNVNTQERAVRGRGASARFKPYLEIPCSFLHMGWEGWGFSFWVHSPSRDMRENGRRVCGTERGHECEQVEPQVGESTHPKKAHRLAHSASHLANLKPEMKSQKPWLPLDIWRNKSLFSWTLWELWLHEHLQYRMNLLLG